LSNSTTILRTVTVTAIFATLSLGAAYANGNVKHSYARSAAARHVTSIRHAPAPRRASLFFSPVPENNS
jgi:hypothetical protein